MAESKGKIGVTTENIFPIIKKFLYSDHEIFLRELVSNAVDATQKLKVVTNAEGFQGSLGNLTIEVIPDKEAKTLTIRDHGIGMTQEEVESYINQIALSGAESFLEKYKDSNIIGHFGLGFYSAFMVSDKVEIQTLSYKEDAKPVHWTCAGDPSYTIEEGNRTERGTDIILHISEDNAEFLEKDRIEELLIKYSRFLPIPIACGKKSEWKDGKEVDTDEPNIINHIEPLWTKHPANLKEEDYLDFYSYLFPQSEKPLFYIHLNVDYPFTLTGVLYFPQIKSSFDIKRNQIQLYSNQVFVTDTVEGIVPEFLTLLHGVLDSPDIPLNVSRSYLQSDQSVKRISAHITKKVADRLKEIFTQERSKFEEKWDDLKLFVEYGMISNEKFYEKAKEFMLLKNVDGKYFTLEEYARLTESAQKDKHGKVIYLYATDTEDQWSYIEQAKSKGYDVLLLDSQIDPHVIGYLEQKLEDVRFARVDSDTLDRIIEKEDKQEVSLPKLQQDLLRAAMQGAAPAESKQIFVQISEMGEDDMPAVITQNEFMRRMKDVAAQSPGSSFYAQMPDSLNLVLNASHPLIKKFAEQIDHDLASKIKAFDARIAPLEKEQEEFQASIKDVKPDELSDEQKGKREELESKLRAERNAKETAIEEYGKKSAMAHQIIDLALLANNMLKGEALAKFVKRSVQFID